MLVSFYYQITFNQVGEIHVKTKCEIKKMNSSCHGSFRKRILIYLGALTVLESSGFRCNNEGRINLENAMKEE